MMQKSNPDSSDLVMFAAIGVAAWYFLKDKNAPASSVQSPAAPAAPLSTAAIATPVATMQTPLQTTVVPTPAVVPASTVGPFATPAIAAPVVATQPAAVADPLTNAQMQRQNSASLIDAAPGSSGSSFGTPATPTPVPVGTLLASPATSTVDTYYFEGFREPSEQPITSLVLDQSQDPPVLTINGNFQFPLPGFHEWNTPASISSENGSIYAYLNWIWNAPGGTQAVPPPANIPVGPFTLMNTLAVVEREAVYEGVDLTSLQLPAVWNQVASNSIDYLPAPAMPMTSFKVPPGLFNPAVPISLKEWWKVITPYLLQLKTGEGIGLNGLGARGWAA